MQNIYKLIKIKSIFYILIYFALSSSKIRIERYLYSIHLKIFNYFLNYWVFKVKIMINHYLFKIYYLLYD